MLYYILRPIAYFALRVYFRRIYMTGKENIPDKGPIVFAINHPTAFIDPIPITSFFFRYVTHFILRGDMFDTPLAARILKSIKMEPIFRFRDGFDNLRKNQETMDRMEKHLADGGNITIMAEGIRKHEKRLRPIQKGTARMIFGSYGKYKNDAIQVVPVGINFTDALKERSFLMYDFGKPIPIKNYIADFEQNDRRAIKKLTQDIGKGMKPRVIHVNKPEDDQVADEVLDVFRNERHFSRSPLLSKDRSLLESELKLVSQLNELAEEQNKQLKETSSEYNSLLKKYNLNDYIVKQNSRYNFLTIIGLILFLPIFIIGYLVNILPIKFAYNFVEKKIKDPLFYASVFFAVSMLAYWVYWHAIAFVLAIVDIPQLDWWAELLLLFAIPASGLIALNYKEIFTNWRLAQRFRGLAKAEQEQLLAMREKIKAFFNTGS
ncbi:MAG: 1-acyl-sn-glycerol-3-phosphate acyltransferase [Saprospiraceae bacterium]